LARRGWGLLTDAELCRQPEGTLSALAAIRSFWIGPWRLNSAQSRAGGQPACARRQDL